MLDVQLDDGRNQVSGGDLAKVEGEGHLHLFGVEAHVSLDSNLGASPQPQFSPSSGFWNFKTSNKNVYLNHGRADFGNRRRLTIVWTQAEA